MPKVRIVVVATVGFATLFAWVGANLAQRGGGRGAPAPVPEILQNYQPVTQ